MHNAKALLEDAYAAFNRRDIDGVLALMTNDVRWPKVSEGGQAIGKEEIRAYWTRQWSEFDPHVVPLAIDETADGSFQVRVHQLVRNLHGEVLFEGEVLHIYTMRDERIAAMEPAAADSAPSQAFIRRS